MTRFLDRLAAVRGVLVLAGVALVLLNLVVRCAIHLLVPEGSQGSFLLFLFADGNLLLHLGVMTGLMGVLVGDIL
ncbi:MAG: hypothetical protein JXM73_10780 [Anaerolineae bacterium]|nr:hypothetical protein [Anaerolineae bacterium]